MATASSASPGDTMYRGRRRGFNWLAWIWVGPALILEIVFFVYPLINTIILSFLNGDSSTFVGLKNYQSIFTSANMLEVLRNNVFWLVLGTLFTVGLGLLIAVLVDKVKVEKVVKSAIFIPMAISFVGASVIWRFIYDYQPPGQPQIGLLNAVLSIVHIPAQTWLQDTRFNNFATLAVYVWMWTGFSMVILSAALKGIPEEIVEAARIDGASRVAMFWRITVPLIMPTLAVVTTTAIINLLKIFDVVYVMTGGNYHTSVIGMEFYTQLFTNQNYGLASALAVVLLVTIVPVMYINIRRIRAGGTN